jgi:hypothetical protein
MGLHHIPVNQAKKRLPFCWLDTGGSRVCPPRSPDLIPSKFYVSIQTETSIGNHKAKKLASTVWYSTLFDDAV